MNIKKNTLAYFDDIGVDASFQFFIEKARIEKSDSSETSEMIIEGVASTTNVDHDSERMSDSALKGMATIINEKSVPLRIEHDKSDDAIVGTVFQASIDERNRLTIKAKLNKENSLAKKLYDGLKAGAKLGLSVGGRVKSAARELAEGAGKYVKTFYDVILDEVSVTPRPANYDSWLFNKSIVERNEDTEKFYDSPLYERFLFENPQLDYLAVIEKSIPEKSWVKVEKKEDKFEMKKDIVKDILDPEQVKVDTETKETEMPVEAPTEEAVKEEAPVEAPVEEKTEEVLPAEDVATKSYVDSKFAELFTYLKQFTPATDTEKADENGTETVPIAAKEATESETLPTASVETKKMKYKKTEEYELPDEKKAEEVMPEVVETKATEEAVPEVKEFSATDEEKSVLPDETTKEEDVKPVASETMKEEEIEETKEGEEYELEDVRRAIKKASKKGVTPVDAFVAFVQNFIDSQNDRFAKSGKRVVGFGSIIADTIRHDAEIQKSLREMLSVPGDKKSVSLGSPYVVTKEGARFRLLAEDARLEKTEKVGTDFKSVYNSQLSSSATGEGIN